MREIRLYDSLSGEFVPVSAGDAIRVEVRGLSSGTDGYVDVESTRPLVLFGFLERFLCREGFATKFLFDSPDDEDTLYEIAEAPEAPVSDAGVGRAGRRDAELGSERRAGEDGERCAGEGGEGEGGERRPGEDGEGRAGESGEGRAGESGEGRAGEDGEGRAGEDGEGRAGEDGEGGAGEDGEGRAGEDGEGRAGEDGEGGAGEDGEGRAGEDGEGRAGEDGEGRAGDGERRAEEGSERSAEEDDDWRAEDDEQDVEMSLVEVQRSDVEQWVNVCFGAGREGTEHSSATSGERVLLSHALEEFGHSAVALYLLGTHYSLPLGDAHAGLRAGSRNASSIRKALERLVPDQPSPPDMRHYVEDFRDALANDLDTPTAFVVMFEWLLEAERRGCEVGDNDLRVMLEVFELEDLATPTGVS